MSHPSPNCSISEGRQSWGSPQPTLRRGSPKSRAVPKWPWFILSSLPWGLYLAASLLFLCALAAKQSPGRGDFLRLDGPCHFSASFQAAHPGQPASGQKSCAPSPSPVISLFGGEAARRDVAPSSGGSAGRRAAQMVQRADGCGKPPGQR